MCVLQGKVHLELRLSEVITDSGVINHKLATRWGRRIQAEADTHTLSHFSTLYFSYIVIFHITILLKKRTKAHLDKHPVGHKDLNLAVHWKEDKQLSN